MAGGSIGVDSLCAAAPLSLGADVIAGFSSRYDTIRRFQQITLDLFIASLKGDAEPWIAETILSDVPASFAKEYHLSLEPVQLALPVFFRTDEPAPGILSEVQCPGSGWSNHERLYTLYANYPAEFGEPTTFREPLSKRLAVDLHDLLDNDPRVYYLLDNASLPHGARYFIEKTRYHGVRYYSWDPDIHPRECNFVRSHDWSSLLHNNFHRNHMEKCASGTLRYDLSPIALFDTKAIMALPFDERTRDHYDDAIRAIFPYTQLLTSGQVRVSDGEVVDIDTICQTASLRRNVYIKYAGTDVNCNWGSRAVYFLGNNSRVQAKKRFDMVLDDVRRGRPWIIQEPHRTSSVMDYLTPEGDLGTSEGYLKLSGFYGPSGLLGILAYHLRSAKVHGNSQAIMSIVY